ncbi:MAG: hypothetical protein FJ319_02700 [SAR202 cluster bacterium]|nr:hypothetical protein [SAR202 cluster bacterium]
MDKLDLMKLHEYEYVQSRTPVIVEPEQAVYLAIDGSGAPGGPGFQERIGALYGMAYTIKFSRKKAGGQDYKISALEALYWTHDEASGELPADDWKWKLMIRTPDFIKAGDLAGAAVALKEKGKSPAVDDVKLEALSEGRAVQMLHVGPYDMEARTVAEIMNFAERQGLEIAGTHHEIYFSDPGRVAPEKLRTIVRYAVRSS